MYIYIYIYIFNYIHTCVGQGWGETTRQARRGGDYRAQPWPRSARFPAPRGARPAPFVTAPEPKI